MLRIRSTLAASYISVVTGKIGRVVYEENGRNHYEFAKSDEIMDAYRFYKSAIRNIRDDYETQADFIEYGLKVDKDSIDNYFNLYREIIKRNKRES